MKATHNLHRGRRKENMAGVCSVKRKSMIVLDSRQRMDWQEAHPMGDVSVEMGVTLGGRKQDQLLERKHEASLGGQDSQVKELSQCVTDRER